MLRQLAQDQFVCCLNWLRVLALLCMCIDRTTCIDNLNLAVHKSPTQAVAQMCIVGALVSQVMAVGSVGTDVQVCKPGHACGRSMALLDLGHMPACSIT